MKLFLPVLLFIVFAADCFSQASDFLILKRKNKTAETYFAGSNISFVTKTRAAYDVLINSIQHDTLYIQEFITQRGLTVFGTIVTDTIGSHHYAINYHDISIVGKYKKEHFNWTGSGAALLSGGSLLTVGSGIVYLADRKKFSAPLMIASAGLATLGYFMAKGKSSGIALGKKYRLQYMGAVAENK